MGISVFQAGKGCVHHRGYGVLCGHADPICILVWVDNYTDGAFDVANNQSFKNLTNRWDENFS